MATRREEHPASIPGVELDLAPCVNEPITSSVPPPIKKLAIPTLQRRVPESVRTPSPHQLPDAGVNHQAELENLFQCGGGKNALPVFLKLGEDELLQL